MTQRLFENTLETITSKIKKHLPHIAAARKSLAFDAEGNYFSLKEGFFEIGNWTTSFLTGMALLSFERTGDFELVKPVFAMNEDYRKKLVEHGADTMHDLGFLYSLHSVALHRITGDPESKRTALLAADTLAKRYVANGEYIRAWGRMDEVDTSNAGLAIIDCMMNLPLLFWATEETGNSYYGLIARKHADTTLRNFIREDGSVYHAFRFDLKTGEPSRGDNYCGCGVETYWARGTAWAIYGFALAYGYTGDERYLAVSRKLAEGYLKELGESAVPVWDFRLPAGQTPVVDTSAAAIVACGLMELASHDQERASEWLEHADRMLGALCEQYVDDRMETLGVLKDAQIGFGVLVYTSWGDYFLTEALVRRLHGQKGYW